MALLASACGPGKSDATSGGETSGGDTGDASNSTMPTGTTGDPSSCSPAREQTDDCCCFSLEAVEDTYEGDMPVDTCPALVLCPPLTIRCNRDDPDCAIFDGSQGNPSPITVDDEQALACVLTALRDGTPGLVTWTVSDGLSAQDHHYIAEARAVFTHRIDQDEGGLLYGDVTRQTLASTQKFAFCLADPDLRDRVRCLQSVTTGEVLATCD